MSDETELRRYLEREERIDRIAARLIVCVLCPLLLWAIYAPHRRANRIRPISLSQRTG
jgi:hypothetical protein